MSTNTAYKRHTSSWAGVSLVLNLKWVLKKYPDTILTISRGEACPIEEQEYNINLLSGWLEHINNVSRIPWISKWIEKMIEATKLTEIIMLNQVPSHCTFLHIRTSVLNVAETIFVWLSYVEACMIPILIIGIFTTKKSPHLSNCTPWPCANIRPTLDWLEEQERLYLRRQCTDFSILELNTKPPTMSNWRQQEQQYFSFMQYKKGMNN